MIRRALVITAAEMLHVVAGTFESVAVFFIHVSGWVLNVAHELLTREQSR